MKATFAVAFAAVFVTFAYGTRRVHCPPENDVDVTLLPNPDDCTSYYSCNQGIAWPMYCPGRLHFNAELRVCDSPEHAKCASPSLNIAAEKHRPTPPGTRPTPPGTRPPRPGTRPPRPGTRPPRPGTRPPHTTVPSTTVPPTTVPPTTVPPTTELPTTAWPTAVPPTTV
nr:basic proline-rich protein-like [Osmia lignaria]